MLTIDDLIAKLTDAKNNKLGGNAVVHLCVPEVEYLPIIDTKLELSEDGAVVLLMVQDGLRSPKVVPNVIIDVTGGVVQGVSSDYPVRYLLLDQDNIEAGDVDPEWCNADEDCKRVSMLLDNPAAEIDPADSYEYLLVVDVQDNDNVKAKIDAVVKKGVFRETVKPMDGKIRLTYQFSFNGDTDDALKRLMDAKLPEVLAINPDYDPDANVELVVVIRYHATNHTLYLQKLKEVTGLEPNAVDHQGDFDDVMYDFHDADAFESAMRVKRLVEAAMLKFVESTGITN